IRFGDETDLHYAAALQVVDDPADRFPAHGLVAADLEFGLGDFARFRDYPAAEDLHVVLRAGIPEDPSVDIDRDGDVFGLGLRGNVDGLRDFDLRHLLDHGNRD